MRVALHTRFSTNPQSWHRWVFEQLDLPAGSRILEVGCGPGNLWEENLSRLPRTWRLALSDLSTGMVTTAREAMRRVGTVRYLVQGAEALAFPDERFDAVLANHMLYHVPDRARALAEFSRVLAPGGRLFAATNGRSHLEELWSFITQAIGPGQGPRPEAAWQRAIASFSLETGGALLERFFSEVRRIRYPDALAVTEVPPLVAFAASTSLLEIDPDALNRLQSLLEEEMAARGAIHIRKDSGLFLARKAR